MPKVNKQKPTMAQAPVSTSPKLTTSSINVDPILGYKIRVPIHDFLKEAKDPDAQERMNSTTEANYISGPYFDQEQAKQVREATVDVELSISISAATQDNHEGDETGESGLRIRIHGLIVEEAIETVMNGYLDKRRASGDARPCGPHDLAPYTGTAVQMSAPEGGSSDRSDAASPMSIASDTSDEGIELEVGDSSAYIHKDNDSTLDERMSSYTKSVTSSVVDYPTEHGRRYHAFRAGGECAESLPQDPADFDTAYFAPNDEDLMIRPETKSQQIIGNDLSPVQPRLVPSNVRFEIDDVESDWLYGDQFDLIFSRYMAGSLSDWPTLVSRAYENLRPGGWVEFQDYDFEFSSLNHSLKPHHKTYQWDHEFLKAAKLCGIEPCPGSKLEHWVKDAGFINIGHKTIRVPLGPWAKDEYHQDIGLGNLIQLLDGLEAFTLRLFCGVLGKTEEEVSTQLSEVRQELRSQVFHAYGEFHVVYGQRPE
ncbi:UMTA methyltransferase [Colletotrichum acutatum]